MWTVSPYYQDPLTHHLFDMQLSCGMGQRMVALVRIIKHTRHIHLHLSCIIFSDLVPDIYFHDTDTWDSCDMHYIDYMMFLDLPFYFILWSRVLVILWLCCITITHPGHLMFIIYMSHHACTVSLYMIYRLDFPVIVITFSSRYCQTYLLLIFMPYLYCYCIFVFSLLIFFSLRVLFLVRFWWTFIIFQHLNQKAGIESWS